MQHIVKTYLLDSGFMAIIPPSTQKKKKVSLNKLPGEIKAYKTKTAAHRPKI